MPTMFHTVADIERLGNVVTEWNDPALHRIFYAKWLKEIVADVAEGEAADPDCEW